MAVTTDIARTWRRPGAVMRDLLGMGQREDRAFAYLFAGCLLIFVAQWPRLTRKVSGFELLPGDDVPEMAQLIAYEFMSWLVVWPLLLYFVASVIHLILKAFSANTTPYKSRLALFWSVLASSPAALLYGLVRGLIGPGLEANIVGAIWLAAFFIFWMLSLRAVVRA